MNSEQLKIEPLDRDNIDAALKLVNTEFPPEEQGSEVADSGFIASLDPEKNKDWLEMAEIRKDIRYWVAEVYDKVVGTTGLYSYDRPDEKDAAWIGWTAVDPEVRGKGIGSALYEKVIAEAIAAGKKYLRVYVSDYPAELEANRKYEKLGFKVIKREPYSYRGRDDLELRTWELDLQEYASKHKSK